MEIDNQCRGPSIKGKDHLAGLQTRGKVHKKSKKKKLTSVIFMYVCVAENAELLVFFTFFLYLPHRQFSFIDICLSSKMY